MANIPMKTLKLHGLEDTYTIPTAPEHIGAAPAGFGLGGSSPIITDLNNAINNGWYGAASGTLNIPPVQFAEYSAVFVIRRQSDDITQILFCNALGGRQWIRHLYGQTWSEWVECSPSSFAPAGYGLGSQALMIEGSIKNIDRSGWYFYNEDYSNEGPGFYYGLIHASVSAEAVRLDFYSLDNPSYHAVLEKRWANWGVWEHVNPPMNLGVEYRTTERWNGKPVYTKLIDFGILPNGTEKIVAHGITNLEYPLSVSVFVKSSGWSFTLPSDYKNEDRVSFSYSGVIIKTTVDRTEYTGYATIKYTKL